ncbi:MAG: T9SS type A sorting domain-containing protein [Saprospiraceae bacterium]|nr:T9SS type A sorting domain-containing protein [Saprospiraceae bacterium]
MNKLLVLILSLMFSFGAKAQVDSIHFQFQDTLLKAGTTHTFLVKVREDISEALGFQFCLQFDPDNITFNSIKKYYMPGWTEDNMNIYPLGNPDLIACAVDVITQPYTGHDLIEFEFNVVNDCRVKDVIRILTAYRFKEGDSYSKSEMFFENDTYPIATEYLPFKPLSTHTVITDNIQAFPNPSNDAVTFEFNSKITGLYPLSVYDSRGRLVESINTFVKSGQNNLMLKKSQIGSEGTYFLKLDLGTRIITSKVIIIK